MNGFIRNIFSPSLIFAFNKFNKYCYSTDIVTGTNPGGSRAVETDLTEFILEYWETNITHVCQAVIKIRQSRSVAGYCLHRVRESHLEEVTFEQIEGASLVDTDNFIIFHTFLIFFSTLSMQYLRNQIKTRELYISGKRPGASDLQVEKRSVGAGTNTWKEEPSAPCPENPAAPQTKLRVGKRGGAPRGERPRLQRPAARPGPRRSGTKSCRRRLRSPHWTAFPRKPRASLGAAKD